MGDNGHRITSYAITTQPDTEPRYPSLDAALQAARPALLRLYTSWQNHRQVQVAEFVASYRESHRHPPSAADVAAGLSPYITEPAAAWYLSRLNGHEPSIPEFAESCKEQTFGYAGAGPAAHMALASQLTSEGAMNA